MSLKSAVGKVISLAKKTAKQHLGSEYQVTLVLHTPDGEPEDAVIASTGDKHAAIPGLTSAAAGSDKMKEV